MESEPSLDQNPNPSYSSSYDSESAELVQEDQLNSLSLNESNNAGLNQETYDLNQETYQEVENGDSDSQIPIREELPSHPTPVQPPPEEEVEAVEVLASSSSNEIPSNDGNLVGEDNRIDEQLASDLVAEEPPEVVEESSSSREVRRENSEIEFDYPASPSSSGYAGEMGSSSASVASEIEEVEDGIGNGNLSKDDVIQHSDSSINATSSSAPWIPGKRHIDEDDASLSWRKRKKHFFVLSHSGKPIYSRHGDEHKLAGFSATLQAIISFVENGGDRVKFVRAGNHQVIFLVKGPIYLVCISCTEEPYEALMGQLELIYGQMLLILTKSINRCFEKNPKFDMTPLLGGTDAVFSSLIHSFSWNPATFLHAYTCLPLAYPTRQAAGAILQDVAESGVLFAILMCKHKVVSLVGAQKASLHPDDMLLLANFVLSSESFRTSESFSPICLPRYNPMAFLYAYVQYLDVDTYLMLLTTSSDAFYHLKDCRIRIEMVLVKSNVLSEVQRSVLEGGLRVEDLPSDSSRSGSVSPLLGQNQPENESLSRPKEVNLGVGGPAGLWHFIYRSINLDQYVSSEFSSPITSSSQQKRLYRAYQKLYASMHERGNGPHKTQFRRDENYGEFLTRYLDLHVGALSRFRARWTRWLTKLKKAWEGSQSSPRERHTRLSNSQGILYCFQVASVMKIKLHSTNIFAVGDVQN